MKKKLYRHFNPLLPWIALGLVSLISMASTLALTGAFSREIEQYINPESRLLVLEKTGRAWVEIDFDGKQKRLFESELGPGRYEFAAVLAEIAKTANFSLRIRQGKIEELGGIPAGAIRSWNIYRYDTRINKSMDQITVSGNDYYHIKLEQEPKGHPEPAYRRQAQ